jgi:hypothetical protein
VIIPCDPKRRIIPNTRGSPPALVATVARESIAERNLSPAMRWRFQARSAPTVVPIVAVVAASRTLDMIDLRYPRPLKMSRYGSRENEPVAITLLQRSVAAGAMTTASTNAQRRETARVPKADIW